ASLLHDIGYLLEGGIASLDTGVTHEHVEEGTRVIAEYFDSRVWWEIGLESADHRHTVLKQSKEAFPPPIETSALGATAQSLCDLGNTSALADAIRKSTPKGFTKERQLGDEPLPRDAFALWRRHFKGIDASDMET